MTLFEFDNELRKEHPVFCGVDEAGRGPLAGDVYAAAVILNPETVIEGLDDSKKLTEKKREKLFDEIIEKADAWCIGTASAAEIDEHNILGATFIAMKRAVEGLGIKPSFAAVDGNRDPKLGIDTMCIVKGDGTSASIAAASILAKVSRDRYMAKLAEEYPQYAFEKHKGYPTKLHYEKLREFGPSPVHRKTFLKKMH
ncbi:MAG: ribonuclease HII [Oscillospiraceae bacterium]|nr:ribonuclease HII [Oscillospiraceae bacterium]